MSKSITLLLVLVFLTATCIIAVKPRFITGIVPVRAQTDIATSAFISVEPNPAEVGQTVTINMLVEPSPPTQNDIFLGFTATITRPDGTKLIIGPFNSYPNGSQYTFYTPVQSGNYTLQLKYPGGGFANGTIAYLSSDSPLATLIVKPNTETPSPSPTPIPSATPTLGASANENSWTSKAPMHAARANLGVAVVNGKIYAIGGDAGSEIGNAMTGAGMTYQVVNTTEEYDPATNTWTFKAPMPTARALFGIAAYQNKIYCIGGYSGAVVYVGPHDYDYKTEYFDKGVNEVNDPAANTWETKAAMPTPRYSAATSVVNGKIYLIGGHTMTDLQITLNVNEVYDPETNSWTTKAPPPYQITSCASVVVDNKIYVIGTRTSSSGSWTGALVQIYDPETDSWSVGASSPTYAITATAGATTGVNAPKRIYFFDETETDVYDPASDSWTVGTSMPTARLIARVAVIDDTFYVVGGRAGQHGYMTFMYPSAVNEQYTPIGYGASVAPSPSPSPSPSPNLSPSPSPSPTATPPNTRPESFPTTLVATVSATSVTIIAVGLLIYFKKRKH